MRQLTSSVIICTRNRPNDMRTVLTSLQQQTAQPTELIVVDSSDTPLDEQQVFFSLFLQKNFPHTRLIYKPSSAGLTHQRNVGTSVAVSDIVHFLDDDVVLQPDYLAQMNKIFACHKMYDGGMGSVTNIGPNGSQFFKFFRAFFLLPRDYADGQFTLSGMPTHAYGSTIFKVVRVLGGCCMAYRKTVLDRHRFDERLGGYGYMEDCDFSWRVSCDKKLFFNPSARLVHNNSPVSRDKVMDNRAMFIRNYSYLFFKNTYRRNRLKIFAYWWSIIGLFTEALLLRQWQCMGGYVVGLWRYLWFKK